MDIFGLDFWDHCVINRGCDYEVSEDGKTESLSLLYRHHLDDGTVQEKRYYFFRDDPAGENWMKLMDLQDRYDQITEDVLTSLWNAVSVFELPEVISVKTVKKYLAGRQQGSVRRLVFCIRGSTGSYQDFISGGSGKRLWRSSRRFLQSILHTCVKIWKALPE